MNDKCCLAQYYISVNRSVWRLLEFLEDYSILGSLDPPFLPINVLLTPYLCTRGRLLEAFTHSRSFGYYQWEEFLFGVSRPSPGAKVSISVFPLFTCERCSVSQWMGNMQSYMGTCGKLCMNVLFRLTYCFLRWGISYSLFQDLMNTINERCKSSFHSGQVEGGHC